jgi:hypothetical protein
VGSRLYRPRPSILCDKTLPGASSGFFEENKACYVASSFERPTSYETTSTNERTPRCDATGSDERPTTHARAETNERPTTYEVGKRKLAAFTKRQAEVVRAAQECSICIAAAAEKCDIMLRSYCRLWMALSAAHRRRRSDETETLVGP